MATRLHELVDDAALLAELEETILNLRSLAELQEPGWTPLSSGGSEDLVASQIDRAQTNAQARWYYYNDPSAQQAVLLHNAYTFARGVSFKAKDPDVQKWLERFWNNQRNRNHISRAKAQWELNRERQLDGELYFVFYVSTLTGRVTVRTFDPGEITQIVCAPGDPTFPIYFQRTYQPRIFNFTTGKYVDGEKKVEYYPDFRNAGPHPGVVQWPANTEICVMHVCTNPLAGRGLSHLATAIPWIKAFKGFMEDRATLTLALATFAFKQKVKGNRQAMARVMQQWGDYETALRYGPSGAAGSSGAAGTGDGRERRQGANTLVENDAASLEQLKTDSGATNAYTDGRMLRQQVGIGAGGIFEHYISGDPSTGNLATATAMELPMLKMFEFEQQLWIDVFSDIFWFVTLMGLLYGPRELQGKAQPVRDFAGGSPLWEIDAEEVDLSVEVSCPPIVQSDIAVQANALASIASAEQMTGQQIVPAEQKAYQALQLLGFNNAGEIVDGMKQNGFALVGKPPAETGAALGVALGEAFVRKLREAADEPPDVGQPLDKTEGEKVEKITKKELDQYFDEFEDLPELDELLKKLGLTLADVDESVDASAGVSFETPGEGPHA